MTEKLPARVLDCSVIVESAAIVSCVVAMLALVDFQFCVTGHSMHPQITDIRETRPTILALEPHFLVNSFDVVPQLVLGCSTVVALTAIEFPATVLHQLVRFKRVWVNSCEVANFAAVGFLQVN